MSIAPPRSGESEGPTSSLKKLDYSILQQCMHCGMCLPTCPTYMETKRERNSPRGRIALMRAIADGESRGDHVVRATKCTTASVASRARPRALRG